jgi:hypothetical protein
MWKQVEVLETLITVYVMKNRCVQQVERRRCRLPCIKGLVTCHVHASECCICQCKNTSESATLGCGHIFHSQCISQWFGHVRRCPMCRSYNKPTNIHIFYEHDAPRLDQKWLKPILVNLADQERLMTDRVGVLSSGELVQSNGDFIQFLWGK